MERVKNALIKKGVRVALHYLDQDFEHNLPKIVRWVDRFDVHDNIKRERDAIRDTILDPSSPWYAFLKRLWEDLDRDTLKQFFSNFLVNSTISGNEKRRILMKQHDCNIPWAILMDPTSSCNLNCIGCWASEYGDRFVMSLETLDRIVTEGKSLGTYMYIFSGGEPLVRKKDIIQLCETHTDCQFLAFTNGTLIDEAFADEMLRVKNFIPAISIEGFQADTDHRRGEGTFNRIENAMGILRNRCLPFGASCCYTSKNTEQIGSEGFVDYLIDQGCLFAWFFTYMPVGNDAQKDLMASAEQREYMFHQLRRFRKSKPIFTMDFWNDGEFVKGCIAGGRCYLHINANGDIEPCAFIHYADSNIYEQSLLETYKRPLFSAYRKAQPFDQNHLRPCPLLDHPDQLKAIVAVSGASSTEHKDPEDVENLCAKCEEQAKAWGEVAERLWLQHHKRE